MCVSVALEKMSIRLTLENAWCRGFFGSGGEVFVASSRDQAQAANQSGSWLENLCGPGPGRQAGPFLTSSPWHAWLTAWLCLFLNTKQNYQEETVPVEIQPRS